MNIKSFILSVLLSLSIYTINAQKLSGVVTYYHNDYLGDRPDLGAKVILLDSSQISNQAIETISEFMIIKEYQSQLLSYQLMIVGTQETVDFYSHKRRRKKHKAELEESEQMLNRFRGEELELKSKLAEFGVDSEDKFRAKDIEVSNILFAINRIRDAKRAAVDAIGKYELELQKGKNYLFIVSNNRTQLNLSENEGMLFFKTINILKDEDKFVNHNFK